MLLALFLGAQAYSKCFPIHQFSWIEFSDEDDSFQVEQFLRISGERDVPALLDNPVSHGSELLVLGPLYGKIREFFKLTPMAAFIFLKIFHLGCAVLSLGCLPGLVRRAGGPEWVGPLSIALVAFNPLFFNSAPMLKEDANVMLAAVMISLMCLFQYVDTGQRRWLVFSIVASAVGAAVKWWGVFLLPAQIYSVVPRVQSDRSLLKFKTAALAIFFVGVLWLGMAVIQLRYLNRFFPEYSRFLPSLGIIAIAIVFAVTVAISVHFWVEKFQFFGANWIYAGICIGEFFALFCSLALTPLLFGPEFPHSVRYFSKYLGVRPSSVGFVGSLWHNIVGWGSSLRGESGISWPLAVVLVGSFYILVRGQISLNMRRKMTILALWIVSLGLFLLFFVTKFNPPTLALMFPSVVLMALVPVSRYGMDGPLPYRRWVLFLCWGLSLCALSIQARSIPGIIRSDRMLPENVKALNRQLEAGFPLGGMTEVWTLGREFPFLEGRYRLTPMDRATLEREMEDLTNRCLDGSIKGPVAIVLGESRKGFMGYPLSRLEASPCVEHAWDLAVSSQKRGHEIQRTYRAVLWASPPRSNPIRKAKGA